MSLVLVPGHDLRQRVVLVNYGIWHEVANMATSPVSVKIKETSRDCLNLYFSFCSSSDSAVAVVTVLRPGTVPLINLKHVNHISCQYPVKSPNLYQS